jgi:hypothetical protein
MSIDGDALATAIVHGGPLDGLRVTYAQAMAILTNPPEPNGYAVSTPGERSRPGARWGIEYRAERHRAQLTGVH